MLFLTVPDIEQVKLGNVTMVVRALSPLHYIWRNPISGKITRITRIVGVTPRKWDEWLSANYYAAEHPFDEVVMWYVGGITRARQRRHSATVPVRITRIVVDRLSKMTEEDAERCGFDPLPCPVCEDVRGTIHDLGGCSACGGLGVMETELEVYRRHWDATHPEGQKWVDDPIVAFVEFEKAAEYRYGGGR